MKPVLKRSHLPHSFGLYMCMDLTLDVGYPLMSSSLSNWATSILAGFVIASLGDHAYLADLSPDSEGQFAMAMRS